MVKGAIAQGLGNLKKAWGLLAAATDSTAGLGRPPAHPCSATLLEIATHPCSARGRGMYCPTLSADSTAPIGWELQHGAFRHQYTETPWTPLPRSCCQRAVLVIFYASCTRHARQLPSPF